MSSNLELLEQRIANLEAEKDELKGENAELKNENAKLKRIIEENARRDAENVEHKVRILGNCAKLVPWQAMSGQPKSHQEEPANLYTRTLILPMMPQDQIEIKKTCL